MPAQHIDGTSIMPLFKGDKSFKRGAVLALSSLWQSRRDPGCAIRLKTKVNLLFLKQANVSYMILVKTLEKATIHLKLSLIYVTSLRNCLTGLIRWKPRFQRNRILPLREGKGSGADVELPFDEQRYDADVYYGRDLNKFH